MKDFYEATEKLLKRYRNLSWVVEYFPEFFEGKLMGTDIDFHLDGLPVKIGCIEDAKSVLRSIEKGVEYIAKVPNGGEDLHEILYLLYINPQSTKKDEIYKKLNISRRTFYRLRKKAITMLSLCISLK